MINRLRHSQQHFGGWLALTAVFVLLVGKSVHLGQECGDNCCVIDVEAAAKSPDCSCCHHSSDASEDESGGEQNHDQHQCPVCSVLSHVTQCPLIVGLPSEFQLVTLIDDHVVCVATAGPQASPLPRGPPESA